VLHRALSAHGYVLAAHGDLRRARARYEEALALARRLQAEGLATETLNFRLGPIAERQGDFASARACYEEALASWRRGRVGWGVPAALQKLARLDAAGGDPVAALAKLEEATAVVRAPGDRERLGVLLDNVARVALVAGDAERARAAAAEGRRLAS